MHEYSIVQALIDRVEKEAASREAIAVHKLSVRIGELSGVETTLLHTAFMTFREETICRNAELEINAIEALWACPKCNAPIVKGGPLRCGSCGSPATLCQGDEIMLDQIEMEVA